MWASAGPALTSWGTRGPRTCAVLTCINALLHRRDVGERWPCPYKLGDSGLKTDKWLLLERGTSQRYFPMALASASGGGPVAVCFGGCRGLPLPTLLWQPVLPLCCGAAILPAAGSSHLQGAPRGFTTRSVMAGLGCAVYMLQSHCCPLAPSPQVSNKGFSDQEFDSWQRSLKEAGRPQVGSKHALKMLVCPVLDWRQLAALA